MKVDILAFAAHPDDIEISCSGTLMKHIDMGLKVAIVDLTQGELGSRGTIETRYNEAKEASKIMGIHDRQNLKMEDGFFSISTENKLEIVKVIRYYQPEILIANSISDRHPDHGRASQMVKEACFLAGLLKIETHYNNKKQNHWRPKSIYFYIQDRFLKPDFIVDITPYVDRKIESLQAYQTQFFNANSTEPATPISGEDFFEFLKGRWKEFGREINVPYGEGFTIDRALGVNDLKDLF